LSKDESYQEFDDVSTEIGWWRVKKVLVDVSEHARTCSKVVECSLDSLWIGATLGRSYGRVGSCNLKKNRSLFVCDGWLGGELVCEGIVPREVDANFREAQFQQF
jgi:hypothetical protein